MSRPPMSKKSEMAEMLNKLSKQSVQSDFSSKRTFNRNTVVDNKRKVFQLVSIR